MRRIFVVALCAFGVWLLVAVVVGVYYAADGGHSGKPSVILASVVVGIVVLIADALLIRRLWTCPRRQA